MSYVTQLSTLFARFTRWRQEGPVDDIDGLAEFVATRSAFIAQKKLYGYLRTRIGTRYPKVFEDAPFVESINIAKMNIFAACVSDLAVFAVARALAGSRVGDETRCAVARELFERALAANSQQALPSFDAGKAKSDFSLRLSATDWSGRAQTRENFDRSPAALVRWAPIAPELKRHDEEIVENSVRFAWSEVRRAFDRRLDAAAIAAQVEGSSGRWTQGV